MAIFLDVATEYVEEHVSAGLTRMPLSILLVRAVVEWHRNITSGAMTIRGASLNLPGIWPSAVDPVLNVQVMTRQEEGG